MTYKRNREKLLFFLLFIYMVKLKEIYVYILYIYLKETH